MSALMPANGATSALIAEVRQLIADARLRAASAVNAELSGLYWQVGQRIHREVLGSRRAGYGEEIVSALRRQLNWGAVQFSDSDAVQFLIWTDPWRQHPVLRD